MLLPQKFLKVLTRLSIICLILSLWGCTPRVVSTRDGPPRFQVDVSKVHDAVPQVLPKCKYGNPRSYTTNGHRYYVLKSFKGYSERGIASWYGTKFQGKFTSTRERYDLFAMTAASKVLPIPCFARVTNLENGKTVVVKVNDRGPFAANRIIDLSYAAAKKLDYTGKGTALVQVTAIDPSHPFSAPPIPSRLKNPHLYLQLGAFTQLANAEKLEFKVKHLTSKSIRISKGQLAHHAIYKVQIGPLANVAESDSLHARLKNRGLVTH